MDDIFFAYRVLVGKPDRKRLLGRLRRKWNDDTETDLKEVGLEGLDWIDLAEAKEKVSGSCERGNEPSGSIKYEFFF